MYTILLVNLWENLGMRIVEKNGRRVAIMESLVSHNTGQSIEVEIKSADMEQSMRNADRLGQNMAAVFMHNFAHNVTSA